MKLTQKQLFIGGLLVNHVEGLNVYEFIKTYTKELTSQNIDIQRINSVNSTLSSLATKELVTKDKMLYNDKIVTRYIPNQALTDFINSVKENN